MASNIVRIAYGVVAGAGIDTKGMSPEEAIEKMNEIQNSDKISDREMAEQNLKSKGYTSKQLKEKSDEELQKLNDVYEHKSYSHKASTGNVSDANSGYSGYSMSKRAAAAYSQGEQPLSKWNKEEILDAVSQINTELYDEIKKLPLDSLKELCLSQSSWHHTSEYMNKTDFYAIDEDKIKDITKESIQDEVDKTKRTRENIKAQKEKDKDTHITAYIRYTEWTGTGRHKKPVDHTELVSYKPSDTMITTSTGNKRLTSVSVLKKVSATKPLNEAQFEKEYNKQELGKYRQWAEKKLEALKDLGNTDEVISEFKKLSKDGFEYSNSGKIYARGRKPNASNYDSPNWFKKGEKRLSPVELDSGKYYIETYNGKEWVR